MAFSDGIVDFWGDLKEAWHDSALPGQPGYIGPEPETEITQIKPSVAETQNNMTVPVANYNYDSIYGTPNEVQGFGIGSDRPYVSTPMGETAVQQRPWKPDEIDISTVGTHNSGERGYDSVGNLKEGWALGIDGVPYNTALFALNDAAIAAAGGGGGGYGGGGGGSSAPAALLSQDLSQRPLSGTYYAPDLSAYNDSSLFNYTGPGGLSEYIYGQGLPYQGAGYDIWGTPTDMVNPYYTGQFAPESTGVADGAISLPPVDMPAGVAPTNNNPNVGTSNTNFDPYKGEAILNQNVIKTTFPSPPGANPSLADRQREQMGAEKWDAMVAQANAMDRQLRESQLGNVRTGLDGATGLLNYGYEDAAFDAAGYDNFIMGDDGSFYQGDAGRGTIVEQPGDRYNAINPGIDAAIAQYNRENPTPENFWSTRTQEAVSYTHLTLPTNREV